MDTIALGGGGKKGGGEQEHEFSSYGVQETQTSLPQVNRAMPRASLTDLSQAPKASKAPATVLAHILPPLKACKRFFLSPWKHSQCPSLLSPESFFNRNTFIKRQP